MIQIIEASGPDPSTTIVEGHRREAAEKALRQFVIEDLAMGAIILAANASVVRTQLPGFGGSEYRRYEGDFEHMRVFYQLAYVYAYAQNVHCYTSDEITRAHQSMQGVLGGKELRLQDHITHFVRGYNPVMSAMISLLVSSFNRTHGVDYERELLQLSPEKLLDMLIATRLDHMVLDQALAAVR